MPGLVGVRLGHECAAAHELLDRVLYALGDPAVSAAVEAAILERENKMSTGMQQGIALPHGKTDAVPRLVTCIGLKKEGMDFGSLDGEPSRIFIMTVSRRDSTGPHIKFLAGVSKVLNSPALRDKILAATSREELLNVLTG